MNFDDAFHRLLGHEGGFVDHPKDPGGATNWGITERVARANGYTGDMRSLPVDFAKRIYRNIYWQMVRAEEMPATIRYALFDAAVNSGHRQAIIWLQRSLGVKADGIIGPITLGAVNNSNPQTLLRKMLSQRLTFMTNLNHWPTFGRGWARRIADLLND